MTVSSDTNRQDRSVRARHVEGMAHKTIRNCAVKFRFRCPKTWDELQTTEDEGRRFCGECERSVFLCNTDAETILHARAGHCVARRVPDELMMIGEPESDESEARILRMIEREEDIDRALRAASWSTRECPMCHWPLRDDRSTCLVCRADVARPQT